MQTKDKANFHIVLVKAWVRKDDKFLIAKRATHEVHAGGDWSVPGGKVDNTVEQSVVEATLRREIEEEVGIQISESMEYLCSNSFIRDDGAHVVTLMFVCQYFSGEARPLEDTSEIRWLSLDELNNFPELPYYMRGEIDKLIQHEINE